MSYHKEIERMLGGPTANAAFLARYIGAQKHEARKADEQSRWIFWGANLPHQRSVAKTSFSFSHLSDEEQWKIWLKIWKATKIYDVKSIAQHWMFSRRLRPLRLKNHKDLFAMADDIDNWAHSDSLSSVLAEVLEEKPALFSIYKKWNRSKNPWLRRQSLVGIYCYARMRKKHVPVSKSLPLVARLLDDPHFYVQRAVGWTLREIDRVDAKAQRAFVLKYLNKINSVAWFATSELYPGKLRKELVAKRKSARTRS